MIRLLAQIISHQLATPTPERAEKAAAPPVVGPTAVQTFAGSGTAISVTAAKPATARPTPSTANWPQPSSQALVVLFSELAQRHLHSARAQTGGDR